MPWSLRAKPPSEPPVLTGAPMNTEPPAGTGMLSGIVTRRPLPNATRQPSIRSTVSRRVLTIFM